MHAEFRNIRQQSRDQTSSRDGQRSRAIRALRAHSLRRPRSSRDEAAHPTGTGTMPRGGQSEQSIIPQKALAVVVKSERALAGATHRTTTT
jgi:hypothetical protein